MLVADWPALPGAYILFIQVHAALEIAPGALAKSTLPAGLYAYVGSARGPGGLRARLTRHMRPDRRIHWHVDHLTRRAPVVAVLPLPGSERSECGCLKSLLAIEGVSVPVRGFGSTDCRAGCPAHLVRLPDEISLPELEARLR